MTIVTVRWCTNIIEQRGSSDVKSLEGIYRLSGQSSQIKALRLSFDAGQTPTRFDVANIHSVGSLLKVCHPITFLRAEISVDISSCISESCLSQSAATASTPTWCEP